MRDTTLKTALPSKRSASTHWSVLLFLLGSAGVLLVFLVEQGIFVKGTTKLKVHENADGVLTARLQILPTVPRLRQDGVLLQGPYDSIWELNEAKDGTFALKTDRVYIRPLAGRNLSFTLDEFYKLPSWSGTLCSALAAVGLIFFFGSGSRPAAPIQPGQKLPYLDGLRGCACAIVFFFHFCWCFIEKERFGVDELRALWGPFPFGVLVGGVFCVQVFFVLSGFVLSLPCLRQEKAVAGEKLRMAIVRRPFRLLGMMLPVMILAYVLGYGYPRTDVATFISDLTTSPFFRSAVYVPQFWTLPIELYGSIGLFLALWLTCGMSFSRKIWFYGWAVWLLHDTYFIGFVAGAALAEGAAAGVIPLRMPKAGWLASIAAAGGLWLAAFNNELGARPGVEGALMAALTWCAPLFCWAAVLVVFGALNLDRFQKLLSTGWIQFLGRVSYALYAVHWFVLYSIAVPLVGWLKRDGGLGLTAAWSLAWIICFFTGIVLAWAATLWIDQPAIRMSKQIANRLLALTTRREEPRTTPKVATLRPV